MFSTLPWYGKAACLIAFFVIMALWGVAWAGILDWMPESLSDWLVAGFLGFSAGALFGKYHGHRF